MKQSHVSKEDTKISAVEIRTDQKKPPIVDKLDVKVESAVASRFEIFLSSIHISIIRF